MFTSKSIFQKAEIILFCYLVFISNAFAQTSVSKSLSVIDWNAANDQIIFDENKLTEFNSATRASNNTTLNRINLPVFVLNSDAVRSTPLIFNLENSYSASYVLNDAQLTVFGSRFVMNLGPDEANNYDLGLNNQDEPILELADDGADLSFSRFNAAYTLRITCDYVDDERCTSPEFLNQVLRELVIIGGQNAE